MKICFISEAGSTHTQRWTTDLSQAGCEIHLISSAHANIPGVAVHVLPVYSKNLYSQLLNNLRIRRLIQSLNPDIIHLFGLFSLSSLGSMLLVKNMKNLVISAWGSDIIPGRGVETRKEKFIKRYLLSHADRIVASSNYLASKVEEYLDSPKKINVLWGVDLDFFSPGNKKQSTELRLGFAKKLHHLSGPDTLLQAFAFARKNCDRKMFLYIAGDGPMELVLKKQAARMGLDDYVYWLGWLDGKTRLRDFYRSIDIFIMPSRRESLGVSAIEASASGLPVIASNFGGIPEIVDHGKTGLLVEPEDALGFGEAIVALAENDSLRKQMGLTGQMRMEQQFDKNVCVKKMADIYRQVSEL